MGDGSPQEIRHRKTLQPVHFLDSPSCNGSELENPDPREISRKPSRISIADGLTIICDDEPGTYPSGPDTPLLDGGGDRNEDDYTVPGFFEYCWTELTRGYSLQNDQSRYNEKRRKLYALLRIPVQVEKFLFYGQLQCIDAFLYLFTFLPLRLLMSLSCIFRLKRWGSAEICDFLKVGIMIFASFVMQSIDTSVVYHEVRSQGVIKLYIFYNMLEVADKLFSSLGQDILEALFWTANEPLSVRNLARTVFHFTIAGTYASAHTFLVLLQATTLNVAFNSHNQALLAIMMSNNFVELKGSVFKKFAKANLFQMACSDVRERFHIMALLFVVILRNMVAVNWSGEHLIEMLPDVMMVLGAELIVDWLKHVFITKFNEINAEVYKDFTITIAFDVVKNRDAAAYSDYSDQVSRRMGFIPIPLSIMLLRVLSQTFSFNNWPTLTICFVAWLILLSVKICNGLILLGMACQHVTVYRDLQARDEYDLYRKRMVEKKSKSEPSSPKISLVDFTDVCHQPSGTKGFTVSDVIDHLREIQVKERWSVEKEREERTPRRTYSMANLSRAKRDKSEPPAAIQESEEKASDEVTDLEDGGQPSPKKRMASSSATDCGDLSSVTAYTMLPPEQGVERIE